MFRTTRRWLAANLAMLLLAVIVGAACSDACDNEQQDRGSREFARFFNLRAQAAKTVTPGPAATPPRIAVTATPPPTNYRYAVAAPIEAVFDQAAFTTTYTLKMTGGFPEGAEVTWAGPNCGSVSGDEFRIPTGSRRDDATGTAIFKWTHPHPPCAIASNHSDVTVVATLVEGSGSPGGPPRVTTVCSYPGSGTGSGPSCQLRP